MRSWSRFAEAREAKSAEYKEGLEAARVAAVKDCLSLAEKLSPREKEEVGKVMAYAAKVDASDPADELLSSWREKAEARKRVMSGKAQ
jgi:hypothetical protein